MTELQGQDCQERTAWKGQLGQHCPDWTSGTGLSGQDCQSRTVMKGQLGQDCQDWTKSTGLHGQYCLGSGTGPPVRCTAKSRKSANSRFFSFALGAFAFFRALFSSRSRVCPPLKMFVCKTRTSHYSMLKGSNSLKFFSCSAGYDTPRNNLKVRISPRILNQIQKKFRI